MSVSDFAAIINKLLPEPHAGLLVGILFGIKAQLPFEFKQALITTGTIHITALSGMNVSLISALVAGTLLRYFSRPLTSLLTIIIIIGFVLFVGPSPSIVRAAVMGCLSLVGVIFGAQRKALYLLIVTVVCLVAVYPPYFEDISFQLSVLATLGIILFGGSQHSSQLEFSLQHSKPALPKWCSRVLLQGIKNSLRVTLAAQLFTTPLIVFEFERVSFIAPVTNLLIGVLIAPITVAGMALCIVGAIYLPFAFPLSWCLYVFLEYMVRVIEISATIPYASINL